MNSQDKEYKIIYVLKASHLTMSEYIYAGSQTDT